MFGWSVLKRGIPESVQFCIGDLPMYTFLVPTHPYKWLPKSERGKFWNIICCGKLHIS